MTFVNLKKMENEFTHIYVVEYYDDRNEKCMIKVQAKNIIDICDFLRDRQIVAWTDDILSVKVVEW